MVLVGFILDLIGVGILVICGLFDRDPIVFIE